MKLVHYLSTVRLAEGGVCRAVLDICAVMAGRGHDVTLATHDPLDVPPEWSVGGAGLPRLLALEPPTLPGGLLGAPARRRLGEALSGADVAHLHTPWDMANLQCAAGARRAGVPYVLSVHGMLDDWSMAQRGAKKRLYLALAGRRLLEQAAFVHCTAEAELRQASRWFPRGRGAVIPLIFDLGAFAALPGPAPARAKFPALDRAMAAGEPVVLYLGRLHVKKGVDVLLRAMDALVERGVNARLLIAGTGDADYTVELRAAAARAPSLAGRVDFLGMVVGVEKISLFEAADVFALPTSQENFGFVLVEALACATPVVTTKGVDIWPELERSGGALIVDRGAESVADAVEPLLRDAARRRAMGEAGRRWILEQFDADRVARQYEDLYARAAERRPTTRS